MKYKIGIFGSAGGDFQKAIKRAQLLAEELGKNKKNVIVITGATRGLPYEVASRAKKKGVEIWGYSPAANLAIHNEYFPDCNSEIYDKLFYVPKDYEFISAKKVCLKYRNVTSTANCDAGIIISGRWGSLNEFTNLIDMGKIVGVLKGSGGIADELYGLSKRIKKEGQKEVIFDSDPKTLVKKILNELSAKTSKNR